MDDPDIEWSERFNELISEYADPQLEEKARVDKALGLPLRDGPHQHYQGGPGLGGQVCNKTTCFEYGTIAVCKTCDSTDPKVRNVIVSDLVTRAEIENELRKYGGDSAITYGAAISVTERLLRKQRERWGHVEACNCHPFNGEPGRESAGYLACPGACKSGDVHPYRDPRCAPQEKPSKEDQ